MHKSPHRQPKPVASCQWPVVSTLTVWLIPKTEVQLQLSGNSKNQSAICDVMDVRDVKDVKRETRNKQRATWNLEHENIGMVNS